jgi:hypothetical protein
MQRHEYPPDRPPMSTTLPALQPADERRVDIQATGELLLRDAYLVAESTERFAESELRLFLGRFGATRHREKPSGRAHLSPGYLGSG